MTFLPVATASRHDKAVCNCKTLTSQIKLFSCIFPDDYTEYHAESAAVLLLLGSLFSQGVAENATLHFLSRLVEDSNYELKSNL